MPCAEGRQFDASDRRALLQLARGCITHALAHGEPPVVRPGDYGESLRVQRASFVTLLREGQLRGCIGSLEAIRPLVVDVCVNACAAAFRDPRFPPLRAEELPGLDIQVSVLSAAAPLHFRDEGDLLAQLRPGTDGLILQLGARRATFLPTVWGSLPEPGQFLRALKCKAGIAEGEDLGHLKAWRYTAECFSERELAR